MSKNVILIFGASGSGTSTLAKYISNQLNYTFIDIDDYYWLKTKVPYTERSDVETRINKLKNDIENSDNVVMSGSLLAWGNEIKPYLTLAIRLETSTDIRIKRIQERDKAKYGDRILKDGDMYKQYQEYLDRAMKYDDGGLTVRSKRLYDSWQKELTCKTIILSGEDSLEYNLNEIKKLAIL